MRPFTRVIVAARDRQKALALARDAGAAANDVIAGATVEDAVREADVVCLCTHSPDPVIRRAWLRSGAHVNSVGYNTAGREVDEDTVADALVVVESRAATLAPPPAGANDIAWPIRDGRITAEHVWAELGELVAGTRPGRTDAAQLTLYKSVGVAVEDAAAAALALRLAKERHLGVEVELG